MTATYMQQLGISETGQTAKHVRHLNYVRSKQRHVLFMKSGRYSIVYYCSLVHHTERTKNVKEHIV